MRFLRISKTATDYSSYFYGRRPHLLAASFQAQKSEINYDHFAWGDAYIRALRGIGYEADEFIADILPLQRAWAAERGLPEANQMSLERIVLEQVRWFQPEILQFEINDGALLQEIKSAVPSVKLVIGWEGSALSTGKAWRHMDLVLSCAPEAVMALRNLGVCSEHLNHAFDPDVCARLSSSRTRIPISFVGSVIRRSQFHVERDLILARLAANTNIQIYSPSATTSSKTYIKMLAAGGAFFVTEALKAVGLSQPPSRLPLLAQAYRVASPPRLPVNPRLRTRIQPPLFGLDYYQMMHDSDITLNIHADSSPIHASNIRLFEATGVGSCLLTDHRNNIRDLFEPDTEIITYRTAEECLEKTDWLLRNPESRQDIARRGARRTLEHHTFDHRASELNNLIKTALRGGARACVMSCR